MYIELKTLLNVIHTVTIRKPRRALRKANPDRFSEWLNSTLPWLSVNPLTKIHTKTISILKSLKYNSSINDSECWLLNDHSITLQVNLILSIEKCSSCQNFTKIPVLPPWRIHYIKNMQLVHNTHFTVTQALLEFWSNS